MTGKEPIQRREDERLQRGLEIGEIAVGKQPFGRKGRCRDILALIKRYWMDKGNEKKAHQ